MTNRSLIWFKGAHMPADAARVPILSPTAQFGLNVFEGIRGYGDGTGQVYLFRLQDHLKRLMQSCHLMGLQSPYTAGQIAKAICDILHANAMRSDLAVRATLFVEGIGSWSSSVPVDMFVAPILKERNSVSQTSGQRASTASWRRIDDTTMPPRIKAGANYINGRYAHLEALANGADLPILLNTAGKVSEGAGACLMMVRDGVLITPPGNAAILESITRDTLLVLAKEVGIPTQIRDIDRTELYIAEEVFLCGSAAEVIPLTRIDRFDTGDGQPGPVTRKLSDLYFACADGTSPAHPEWRTPLWQEGPA